ncbi:5-formyltetrahydrofolate cyclo-ligase [Lysinibacillus yapensis]|uniref:5-formyltetrahydrofolate cyclo-ligase n=1 Tax=Ureibacillus yapensis TaxID=2304605 RepID=A0A396SIF8_9BACL|nr:5-formyltetrahydrofolate cyclo-ligase [Lysinibacillus yapensis]RHW38505.1 5-formyltetrahydrofolate cyclo-ligase [Lysinibacillus yapensis]
MDHKKMLRTQIAQSLQELTIEQFQQSSRKIMDRLLGEPSIIEGNTIAITISNKREVDTIELIKQLWKLNKTVVVPKCHPKDRTMDFYKIENFDQLETVYMDLKEPKTDCTVLVSPDEIDCMVVPGIVFDKKGYRIGYGGGYYDRYLVRFNGKLISLAFSIQVVESVPVEPHDQPVDLILTETDRIECTLNRKELRS